MALAFAGLSGCSTIIFVRKPETRVYSDALYESSRPFFFFGLVSGAQDVYIDQICLGKDVDQVTMEYTGSNVLTGILTLGIYSPRTVKVWCQL